MPVGHRGAIITPISGNVAPGALDDAMPDHWGQSTIRIVDRPRRLTALDFLYYSGDHRALERRIPRGRRARHRRRLSGGLHPR